MSAGTSLCTDYWQILLAPFIYFHEWKFILTEFQVWVEVNVCITDCQALSEARVVPSALFLSRKSTYQGQYRQRGEPGSLYGHADYMLSLRHTSTGKFMRDLASWCVKLQKCQNGDSVELQPWEHGAVFTKQTNQNEMWTWHSFPSWWITPGL